MPVNMVVGVRGCGCSFLLAFSFAVKWEAIPSAERENGREVKSFEERVEG